MGVAAGSLILAITGAPGASADTVQANGCLGVTGTFSGFSVPITGSVAAAPGTVNPGSATIGADTITLSGTSVTIAVDSALIGAGITTGLVTAAPDLANIGVTQVNSPPDNLTTPNPLGGISRAVAPPNAVKLKIQATKADDGTVAHNTVQTVANSAEASTTFYVTANQLDGSGAVVYSAVSNPAGGLDPTRTGTVLTGALLISIPLANSTWTPTASGTATFREQTVAPANLLLPSSADQLLAPLVINAKINPGAAPGYLGGVAVPFKCWPGGVSGTVAPVSLVPQTPTDIATIGIVAPPAGPVCATPQSASVGGAQSVTVTPSCTDQNGNFTPSVTSVAITSPPTNGTATVGAGGVITYANNGLGASTDTFTYTATDDTALPGNLVTVNIAVLNNQCTASPSCSLRQVLILPVAPGGLSMTQGHTTVGNPAGGDYGNPSFSQAVLGGVVNGSNQCVPGPLTLNGRPQTACGALNAITVVNARGTDNSWSVTGQVSDFIDGTRGPTDTCSTGRNIDQVPPNNHCIPGDNLGWVPMANILHPWVPGDTAKVNAGAVMLSSQPAAQTLIPFPPNILGSRQNANGVTSPFGLPGFPTPAPGAGLHDLATTLCAAPVNQSGGTFQCDAGLILGVPASAAAGTYLATLTITLG